MLEAAEKDNEMPYGDGFHDDDYCNCGGNDDCSDQGSEYDRYSSSDEPMSADDLAICTELNQLYAEAEERLEEERERMEEEAAVGVYFLTRATAEAARFRAESVRAAHEESIRWLAYKFGFTDCA